MFYTEDSNNLDSHNLGGLIAMRKNKVFIINTFSGWALTTRNTYLIAILTFKNTNNQLLQKNTAEIPLCFLDSF